MPSLVPGCRRNGMATSTRSNCCFCYQKVCNSNQISDQIAWMKYSHAPSITILYLLNCSITLVYVFYTTFFVVVVQTTSADWLLLYNLQQTVACTSRKAILSSWSIISTNLMLTVGIRWCSCCDIIFIYIVFELTEVAIAGHISYGWEWGYKTCSVLLR